MRMRVGFAAVLMALCGCVVGAPPGFSSGDVWSFPLIAPFEDSFLYAPVKINGKGPYLFRIDPDSPVSSVDAGIRSSLDLFTGRAPDMLDERDKLVPIALAEVQTISVGNLSVRNRKVMVHNIGTYWVAGRKVRGVLGRDVIADSLMFAVDRDRGMGYIAKQGKLPKPVGAMDLSYSQTFSRRIVTAKVNGNNVTMHLDLGGHTNSMWTNKMERVGLKAMPLQSLQVDEYGTKHTAGVSGVSQSVEVSGIKQFGQTFIPYTDKRMREADVDGTIGLNFFANYNITANWHKRHMWLVKRAEDAGTHVAERLRRFGPIFDGCKNPACMTFKLVGVAASAPPAAAPAAPSVPAAPAAPSVPAAPAAPAAPSVPAAAPPVPRMLPSLEISIERKGLPTYEVLIEALNASGKPVGNRLVATVDTGATKVVARNIEAVLQTAASFRVIDVSPFPRDCHKRGHNVYCVWPLVSRH